MREQLVLEREILRNELSVLIISFMKETDKKVASEILIKMQLRAKRIEAINCQLAGIELRQKIFRKGESK